MPHLFQAVRAQFPADDMPTCHDLTPINEPEEEPAPSSNNPQPPTLPAPEEERAHRTNAEPSSAPRYQDGSEQTAPDDTATLTSAAAKLHSHIAWQHVVAKQQKALVAARCTCPLIFERRVPVRLANKQSSPRLICC